MHIAGSHEATGRPEATDQTGDVRNKGQVKTRRHRIEATTAGGERGHVLLASAITVLLGCMATSPAAAQGTQPAPAARTPVLVAQEGAERTFSIAAQPLPEALLQFREQSGLQVAYKTEDVRGLRIQGVNGTFAPEEALTRLLAGTGLQYRVTAANTVTLERVVAQEGGPIELSPITVVGQSDTGYAADRAISATRTAADRNEIPLTVEIFNNDVIEDVGSDRVGDALRYGAGLVNDFGATGNRFADSVFSRGFASNFTQNGLLRNRIGANNPQDSASVERIEVLKGPASVLYGQLEPGGTINVVTKQPLEEARYSAEASYGSYDFKRFTGDLTGPMFENRKVRFRLNAAYEDSESFKDFYEREHIFLAPIVAIDVGPDTKLTLEAEYTHDDFLFEEGIPIEGFLLPNINGKFSPSLWIGEPDLEGDEIDASVLGYRFEHRFTDWLVLRNAFRWERFALDEASVVPLSLQADQRTVTRALLENNEITNDYLIQTDVVTEFTTAFVDHELLAGFDYRREDRNGSRRITFGLPTIDIFNPVYGTASAPTGPFNGSFINQEVLGFYGQDRLAVGNKITLLGGLRYDISSATNKAVSGTTGGITANSREDEELTTQFGAVFRPFEPLSLFANRAQSFVPQTGKSAGGTPFAPELSTQYEVGARVNLLGDRLWANVSAYQITKENVATTDPNNLNDELAIGETRSRGVETSLSGEVLPGWNLIASYAFTDTKITRDFDGFQGNEFIGVPDHTASLFSRYDVLGGDLAGLGVSGGISYIGNRAGDLDNSFDLPDYVRVDMGLHYNPLENVEAGFFVENVFDEEYAQSGFGIHRVSPGAPRTFKGRLKVRF